MKRGILLMVLLTISTCLSAQSITGKWYGLLKIQGVELRIVMDFTKNGDAYYATMDSPDQGAKGIPVDTTQFTDSKLHFVISRARIVYDGELQGNKIVGTFKQGGQLIPLDFGRDVIESSVKLVRSQEPVKPYPYYSEEVKFKNKKDGMTLSGTLSMPSKGGKYPVVILISGSGPQNRDEELMGHKPFLVLSDYLTRKGMAVLRYDDRGTAQSEGDFSKATMIDFSNDVLSAINYLKKRKDIDSKNIGLIGHSEGGVIAPYVAAKSEDVAFIVLMAGTGIIGGELLLMQQELIAKSQGVSESEIAEEKEVNKGAYKLIYEINDTETLKKSLTSYYQNWISKIPSEEKPAGVSDMELINIYVSQLSSPWMQYFIKYDPSIILKDVKCPVLALNGSKDLQVPSKINLDAIRAGLEKGGNLNVTLKEFPNMNHLFQECETGAIEEYAAIDQTISPIVLNEIGLWLSKVITK